ncbi:MAG: hypothetical protein WCK65_12270 [Rhodospirillaceae bacterium]
MTWTEHGIIWRNYEFVCRTALTALRPLPRAMTLTWALMRSIMAGTWLTTPI